MASPAHVPPHAPACPRMPPHAFCETMAANLFDNHFI